MLEEKILNDYKEAMKARDSLKSSTLSFLRAEMINAAVAKNKKALDDEEVISVIKKQIKQHQDSIEQFRRGNRLELADKEEKELKVLMGYMPAQLSEDEVRAIIEEAVAASGAQGLKDMGRVMKEAVSRIGQSASGKLVSDLVRQRLSKPAP